MIKVGYPRRTVDDDVIELNHHELAHKRPQNLMHESHECSHSIGQTKLYD